MRENSETPLDALAVRWRNDALLLRRRGAEPQAVTLEACAEDLEQSLQESALEALPLSQAARESGYSYSALEKGIRSGRILNAGEPGRPRIRRCDLPRKAGSPGLKLVQRQTNLAEKVLAGR